MAVCGICTYLESNLTRMKVIGPTGTTVTEWNAMAPLSPQVTENKTAAAVGNPYTSDRPGNGPPGLPNEQ